MFSALDWLPTLVEIAGGPKGNELNKQIMAGKYKGIVKTKLDGVNQLAYLTGKSKKSARDTFFYYMGAIPSAVRYKNWKFYYTMPGETPMGGLLPPSALQMDAGPEHQARSVRAERGHGSEGLHGASAAHWPARARRISTTGTCLPIGQMLWEKELMSYKDFPPLQQAASYNLDQILQSIKEHHGPSD